MERPKEVDDLYDIAGKFADLSGWALIGGRCARCEREGWINRDWLEAKFSNAIISELTPKLRCRKCGNKGNNRWILGKPFR
ncbi:hypothetical protein ELI25_03965 [Rhizobium ruizarguesonis]|uniref:hypothetical protein n=1 Tax=Rhizobium ruizarguesonis TaxID=2081791 RepID=UPI00102F5E9F|nr:hypothetical protein [Rhizobium ruizarguesonis]TAW15062.1 hypothetical protein ELI25_03965 [Rhizobium ruizarguesonis]